jgi:cytosine-specific methyltransferase
MSGKVYYSEGLAPTLVRGKGEGFKVAIPCMTPDRLEKDKMVDVSRIIKSQCLL